MQNRPHNLLISANLAQAVETTTMQQEVEAFKEKVTKASSKAAGILEATKHFISPRDNSTTFVIPSGTCHKLMETKETLEALEPEMLNILNDDASSSPEQKEEAEQQMKEHLTRYNVNGIIEDIASVIAKLPFGATQDGIQSQQTRRSRSSAPRLEGQHEFAGLHHGSTGSQQEARGPQQDSTNDREWLMQYVEQALRHQNEKLEQLMLLISSGREDVCYIRGVPNSSGTGSSSNERNIPTGGHQTPFSQAPPQPNGFRQDFQGNSDGNNHGSAHNIPSVMFQETSEEELDRRIRCEQIKSTSISSALSVLKPFSGKSYDYPTFMAQFDFLVHNSTVMDARMKQTILTSLLPAELAREHQTIEVSEEKYYMIRSNLERQFNMKNVQAHEMMRTIVGMTFPEDFDKLRSALNTFQTTAYKLQFYGVNPNDQFFMIQMVDRLPEKIRHIAYKKLHRGCSSLSELTVEIHEAITMQQGLRGRVSTLALGYEENHTNEVNVNAVTHQRPQRLPTRYPGARQGKEFVPPGNEVPCRYCDSKRHAASECNVSHQKKTDAVKAKSLCRNCLSEKHTAIECKSRHSCLNCDRRHFTGHCPQLKNDFKSQDFPDLGYELEDDEGLEKQLFPESGAETPEH